MTHQSSAPRAAHGTDAPRALSPNRYCDGGRTPTRSKAAMMLFRLMDTEVVIKEVQSRECIWNPRNVYYKNKTHKYKAWQEVSVAVLPKYTTCSEDDKRRIVRAVQSRWKTARDAYMKCRLTEVKKPTYKAKQHRYIYQEKLRFLELAKDIDESVNNRVRDDEEGSNTFVGDNSASQSTLGVSEDDVGEASDEVMDFDIDIHEDFKDKIKDVVTAIDDVNDKAVDDDNEDECQPGTSSQNNDQEDPLVTADVTKPPRKRPRNVRSRKMKNNMTEFERRLLKIMRLKNSTSANSSALQTDDQFFFNSLAPLIVNFDIHQKLKFRSKILEVVMEVGNIGPMNIKQERETYVFRELEESKN